MFRLMVILLVMACGPGPTAPYSCPDYSAITVGDDWHVTWYRNDLGTRCQPQSCIYLGQARTMTGEQAVTRCMT